MKALLLTLLTLLALPVQAADYKVGDRLTAQNAKPGSYKEITWDDLMPRDWDPMQALQGLDLNKLQDSDPRAQEALDRLKASWNAAPANPAMAGKPIRIPGFMVPLEWGKQEVKEFLLVPYFGACIHVPPPPSNQVIHVLPAKSVKSKTGMDAVWVSGVLEISYKKSELGDATYRMTNARVEPYKETRR
ncbi:MAG TPA: DUF3299 domain-containing protein [Thiobacillaceae bacterium]|nr:DUF3299 domain-containing protein [Thiobacillaceae bacterium]